MIVIPCERPVYIQGENQSLLENTTIPYPKINKKSQIIAYHFVREDAV